MDLSATLTVTDEAYGRATLQLVPSGNAVVAYVRVALDTGPTGGPTTPASRGRQGRVASLTRRGTAAV